MERRLDVTLAGPIIVRSTAESALMSTADDVEMAEPTNAASALIRMPNAFSAALPLNEGPMMRMPNEVLAEIARFCALSFSDLEPLWKAGTNSDIKAFALVNRRCYDICRSIRLFEHLRFWSSEGRLHDRLRDLRNVDPRLLSTCRSLSIRTIGPLYDMHPPSYHAHHAARRLYSKELRDVLRTTILSSVNLTELRFATDNGGRSMEPAFIKILRPQQITFPNIKSLYLRTETNMATTFECFPNLKAINFNIHCELTRSTELKVLGTIEALRVVSIMKHGRGWVVDDFSRYLPERFPNLESLTLEGFINTTGYHRVPLKIMASEIDAWPSLQKLVISDEPFIYLTDRAATSPTYFDLARSKIDRRDAVAIAFFQKLPNLREIVIGRACDLSAHVYQPFIREDPDSAPVPKMGARLVHVYGPVDRTTIGYQYTARPGTVKWGQPYQLGGWQSEYVEHREVNGGPEWYWYPEMRLQNGQTNFFDTEWLRVIRARGF